MEAVYSDLTSYLEKNIFPSRTVLVFPPFNGFRRFLIHKLIEDNFASSEVAAFSIGEDITRRIVVCYKGLIREGQNKLSPILPAASVGYSMIEKEKPLMQRSSPTVALYKPPAARLADSKNSKDVTKPPDSKRVRRPDQQVYVPRPKRASYGNDQPRSRCHSSSRTSLDSGDEKIKPVNEITEESRLCEANASALSESCKLLSQNENESSFTPQVAKENDQLNNCNIDLKCTKSKDCIEISTVLSAEPSTDDTIPALPSSEEVSDRLGSQLVESSSKDKHVDGMLHSEMEVDCCNSDSKVINRCNSSSKTENCCIINNSEICDTLISNSTQVESSNKISPELVEQTENRKSHQTEEELPCPKVEQMETISISSDSTSSSSSSSGTTSSSDSKSNNTSSDSENVRSRKTYNRDDKTDTETTSSSDGNDGTNCGSCTNSSQKKAPSKLSAVQVSEVLVISDTSSSGDGVIVSTSGKTTESKTRQVKKPKIPKGSQREKHLKKSKVVDPEECDWESLYDDSGECLVPSLMEELTNSVGKVRIASVDNDYRSFQSVEERTNDGECVIEIYDFPAEFKTTDLFNIFAAYRNRNFQIKWVDDTHALGVFPCPLIADEVLACTLPFVKTRPLRLGIAESRIKARNLVLPALPPMERPKTCSALAKRLVSGALGLRLPTSSQEREKEKQMLKEAREKRRLEARQRDAAWNGTLTSDNSC